MLPDDIRNIILDYHWGHWRYIKLKQVNKDIVVQDFISFLLKILKMDFRIRIM